MKGETGLMAQPELDRNRLVAAMHDLYAEYVHLIDDDRLEQWPELFTEGAVYRITTRENYDNGLPLAMVYCDGRPMMADRISALRNANIFEQHYYCHTISAVRLLASDAEGYRTRANFSVIRTMVDGDTMVFATGRSFDRIVEDGGRLRFAERLIILDSRSIDTLLVIPI